MGQAATKIVLNAEESEKLEAIGPAQLSNPCDIRRTRVVLAPALGKPYNSDCRKTGALDFGCLSLTDAYWCQRHGGTIGPAPCRWSRTYHGDTAVGDHRYGLSAFALAGKGVTGESVAFLHVKILQQGIVNAPSLSYLGSLLSRVHVDVPEMKIQLHSRAPHILAEGSGDCTVVPESIKREGSGKRQQEEQNAGH